MDPRIDEVISLLTSMKLQLDAIDKRLSAVKKDNVASTVSDDLDGKYGNPKVFHKLKDWDEDMKGRQYSECPSEFLLKLAGLLEWIANQQEAEEELTAQGKPRCGYTRLDAARARGWAKRNQGKKFDQVAGDAWE
jgi:hypothetical protein